MWRNRKWKLRKQIFSLELLREKFENTLEISGENSGNLVSQNVATLKKDGVPASPPYQGKPCPLGFSCAVSKQFDAGRQNVQT